MAKHKIEHVRYKCPEVNNTVTLDLKYVLVSCNQTPSYKRKLVDFDCNNKENCKVATADPNDSISFNWNLCPAYKEKFK
jgi:hypothetical protein